MPSTPTSAHRIAIRLIVAWTATTASPMASRTSSPMRRAHIGLQGQQGKLGDRAGKKASPRVSAGCLTATASPSGRMSRWRRGFEIVHLACFLLQVLRSIRRATWAT